MIIYFLRHADAEDFVDSDFTRKLTPKGHDQAERVGKFCKQNGIKPEVFLTSPLVRARETAEIVGKKTGVTPVIADWLACGMTPETLIARRPRARPQHRRELSPRSARTGEFPDPQSLAHCHRCPVARSRLRHAGIHPPPEIFLKPDESPVPH
jgi:broad specificity phosphatase PhoE